MPVVEGSTAPHLLQLAMASTRIMDITHHHDIHPTRIKSRPTAHTYNHGTTYSRDSPFVSLPDYCQPQSSSWHAQLHDNSDRTWDTTHPTNTCRQTTTTIPQVGHILHTQYCSNDHHLPPYLELVVHLPTIVHIHGTRDTDAHLRSILTCDDPSCDHLQSGHYSPIDSPSWSPTAATERLHIFVAQQTGTLINSDMSIQTHHGIPETK